MLKKVHLFCYLTASDVVLRLFLGLFRFLAAPVSTHFNPLFSDVSKKIRPPPMRSLPPLQGGGLEKVCAPPFRRRAGETPDMYAFIV